MQKTDSVAPVDMDETPAPVEALGKRRSVPKYRLILQQLRQSIDDGRLRPGDKIPTEAELSALYGASRITVAKAVNDLMQQGLVSRRPGSGTHVLPAPEAARGHVFGLLIPDLGRTEIFEPICQGMMRSPLSKPHSLLWGHSMAEIGQQAEEARQLCHHYIKQKVSGVFFAPLEFSPVKDEVNQQIANDLDAAGIPIVLLDRCYAPYPSRSQHDLVGIDNRAAGYMITAHVVALGAKRPAFFARSRSAATVYGRIAGYREALRAFGLIESEDLVIQGDAADSAFLQRELDRLQPDALICANDSTAGRIITTLNALGIDVPRQMKVTGIDDVKHASLFSVPLTTIHQNCADLGATAMSVMLERLAQPTLPPRDILLQTSISVRVSCGAQLEARPWNKPQPPRAAAPLLHLPAATQVNASRRQVGSRR